MRNACPESRASVFGSMRDWLRRSACDLLCRLRNRAWPPVASYVCDTLQLGKSGEEVRNHLQFPCCCQLGEWPILQPFCDPLLRLAKATPSSEAVAAGVSISTQAALLCFRPLLLINSSVGQ